MQRVFFIIRLLLALAPSFALAEPTPASPYTINIVSGQDRGGFGDIASNILMAEKLKERHPDWTVRLLVNPHTAGKVNILLGDLDPTKTSQVVHGVEILTSPAGSAAPPVAPPADYSLGFSMSGAEGADANGASTYLSFLEYGGRKDKTGTFDNASKAGVSKWNFRAGAGAGGLYVTPEASTPTRSRETLFSELSEMGPTATENIDPKNTVLHFSYTNEEHATQSYVKAVIEAAKSLPKGQTALIVAKDFEGLSKIELPPNVRLLTAKKLAFDMTADIIAHSDRPIMVTGDVSMTLAVQAGVPFFYEMNSWKESAMLAIGDQFIKIEPELRKHNWESTLEVSATAQSKIATMVNVLNQPDIMELFSRASFKFRSENCLPDFVAELLPLMKHMAPKPVSPEVVEALRKEQREGRAPEGIYERARAKLLDGTATHETLSTILSLRQFGGDPVAVKRMIETLTGPKGKDHLIQVSQFVDQAATNSELAATVSKLSQDPNRAVSGPARKYLAATRNPEYASNHLLNAEVREKARKTVLAPEGNYATLTAEDKAKYLNTLVTNISSALTGPVTSSLKVAVANERDKLWEALYSKDSGTASRAAVILLHTLPENARIARNEVLVQFARAALSGPVPVEIYRMFFVDVTKLGVRPEILAKIMVQALRTPGTSPNLWLQGQFTEFFKTTFPDQTSPACKKVVDALVDRARSDHFMARFLTSRLPAKYFSTETLAELSVIVSAADAKEGASSPFVDLYRTSVSGPLKDAFTRMERMGQAEMATYLKAMTANFPAIDRQALFQRAEPPAMAGDMNMRSLDGHINVNLIMDAGVFQLPASPAGGPKSATAKTCVGSFLRLFSGLIGGQ